MSEAGGNFARNMADRRLGEENIGKIIEESAETVRQPSVLFNYLDFQKIKIYPVSYTHLDVYKRQELQNAG